MRNRAFTLQKFALLVLLLIAAIALPVTGCSKKSKKPSLPVTTSTGTGTGTGTTGTGTTGTGTGTITDFGEYVSGTDKWHINFDESTLQTALQLAGLSAGDADAAKTATIHYLESFYSGMQISFSCLPLPGGNLPASASEQPASQLAPGAYNMIAIWNGSSPSWGMAWTDSSGNNNLVENNSGISAYGPLGVFILNFANLMGGSVDNFGSILAVTLAHEIGHSVGLSHNAQDGYIMSAVHNISGPLPSFHPDDVSFLTSTLPGPDRN